MLTRPIRNKALLIKKYKFIFSLTLILYTKAAPAFFLGDGVLSFKAAPAFLY